MKREQRYGANSLERDFPNDQVCLDFLFDAQHSRKCSCGGTYKRLAGRKQYQCSKCRFQIAPTSGTIFHKSDTPLTTWFRAILAFSNAKSSISAKQLECELEVTYKTAWRMSLLIRQALAQSGDQLKGIVEIDTGYLGGVRGVKQDRMSNKTTIMAAVERGGEFRAFVAPDGSAITHRAFLDMYVKRRTHLMSDQTKALKNAHGYDHYTVNHSKKEYVRGAAHTNTVEGFFSHVKRSIKGVHKTISKKHAQAYLNGFVFHYNNRHSDRERFGTLLGILLQPVK